MYIYIYIYIYCRAEARSGGRCRYAYGRASKKDPAKSGLELERILNVEGVSS